MNSTLLILMDLNMYFHILGALVVFFCFFSVETWIGADFCIHAPDTFIPSRQEVETTTISID